MTEQKHTGRPRQTEQERQIQELTRKAALAAGYDKKFERDALADGIVKYTKNTRWVGHIEVREYWEPYYSDQDAIRLAVTLRIDIVHDQARGLVQAGSVSEKYADHKDEFAATRSAILRAAAALHDAVASGFIPRNDPSLVVVPDWAEFVAWAKDGGYDESYLDINDFKCLALQRTFLEEQAECQ